MGQTSTVLKPFVHKNGGFAMAPTAIPRVFISITASEALAGAPEEQGFFTFLLVVFYLNFHITIRILYVLVLSISRQN